MPNWIAILSGWLYLAFITVMLLLVLMRRRSAQAALGWSLAIVLLPVLGSVLFLMLGLQRIPRRLRAKRAHRAAFDETTSLARAGYAAREPRDTRYGRIGRLMERLGEGPRRGGNTTAMYSDGREAFEAMAEAVRAAKHHVHVEVYIFRNDTLGQRVVELLEQKAAEGVEVRLIVDAVGTLAGNRLLRRLREAGGEGASFLPVGLFGKKVSFNSRNHRKIVVCDGKVAFLGGLNVGTEYLGTAGPKRADWYDLHMRLDGPSVRDVQRIFVEDWHFAADTLLGGDAYFPEIQSEDGGTVQVIGGGPDSDANPIRQALLSAVMATQERLWIATPYLVPDRPLMDALRIAAYGGVDVRIVVPAPPADNRLAAAAGLWHAEELLEAGVQIFHYPHGMMHAKAVLADDSWAMLGSANLDNRSLHLNFEVMAILDHAADVAELAAKLQALIDRSDPLALQALRDMDWGKRFFIAGARLLSPLL